MPTPNFSIKNEFTTAGDFTDENLLLFMPKVPSPGRSRGYSFDPGNAPTSASSASGIKRRQRPRKVSEDEQNLRIKRRLEKNRQSARMCRQRKSKHIQVIEDRVSALEFENAMLRLKLENGGVWMESTTRIDREKQLIDELAKVVENGASDDVVAAAVDAYTTTFLGIGVDVQAGIKYHIEQLVKLIDARGVTKVGLMTVDKNVLDGTSEAAAQVLAIVQTSVELSEKQQLQLFTFRDAMVKKGTVMENVLTGVKEVGNMATSYTASSLNHEMKAMLKILSPTQAAKLILLVTTNPTCQAVVAA